MSQSNNVKLPRSRTTYPGKFVKCSLATVLGDCTDDKVDEDVSKGEEEDDKEEEDEEEEDEESVEADKTLEVNHTQTENELSEKRKNDLIACVKLNPIICRKTMSKQSWLVVIHV